MALGGMSLLHYECINGNLDLVCIILCDPCINPNLQDKFGMTPLHRATLLGYKNIVSALVSFSKTDVNITDTRNMTPLHYAAHFKSAEIACILAPQ